MENNYSKNDKLIFYNQRKLDSSKTWILFLLVGWYYGGIGQMGKQILYYLTLGGLGLWILYLLFTLNSKIKKYNRDIAHEIGLDEKDMSMLGLSIDKQEITVNQKNKNRLINAIVVIFAILIIGYLLTPPSEARKKEMAIQEAIDKKEELKKEKEAKIESQLSSSTYFLSQVIKVTLKDPKSYEEISHNAYYDKDKDSSIVASVTYRSTNSFGAYIQETKKQEFPKNTDFNYLSRMVLSSE